jgi:hypothetical protein
MSKGKRASAVDPELSPARAILHDISKQLADQLAELAKIPRPFQKNFRSEELGNVLSDWLYFLTRDFFIPEVTAVLDQVRELANQLSKKLEVLEKEYHRPLSLEEWHTLSSPKEYRRSQQLEVPIRLERLQRTEAVRYAAIMLDTFLSLGPNALALNRGLTMSILLTDLSYLIEVANVLKRQMTGHATKAGRPEGAAGNRALSRLVFTLERCARRADGSFTVNPRDNKGTMLDALDLLPLAFLARPETRWLSEMLPLPDRHPVSTYQRIIRRARNSL